MQTEAHTRKRILLSGKAEFLLRGFEGASLRTIAGNAGVTTGAIYQYFPNKEALFDALVREPAENLIASFSSTLNRFSDHQPETQIEIMHNYSVNGLSEMLECIFTHYDSFKLIVCSSTGTFWENYIDRLIEMEVEATEHFITIIRDRGNKIMPIDRQLIHILASTLFYGLFEIITQDTEKQKALEYIDSLQEFYRTGWDRILGLDI